jgi:glycosyltransferase involved in cell wall biosynthesis
MSAAAPHITVCVCTFRRERFLRRLLEELARQETGGRFTFSVVVADNDGARSAATVVAEFSAQSTLPVIYCAEPRQNIALARNCALAHARGEYAAFIDDDEFPAADWLAQLFHACQQPGITGVLGPVRPHFEAAPPPWIIRGRFCERPEMATGSVLAWTECRTGNVLFRREAIRGLDQPFREQFGTGGEDKDFFMRLSQAGARFVWCNEAAAYETVPPERWTRGYMLRRALLRGRIALKNPERRWRDLATSCVAVPMYSAVLPFAFALGHHVFMKYCIRLCDHLGRVLTVVGLNPVSER